MTRLLKYEKSLQAFYSITRSSKSMKKLLLDLYREKVELKEVVFVACPHCEELNQRVPEEVRRINKQIDGALPEAKLPDLRCSFCRKRLIHRKNPLRVSHYGIVEFLDPIILQSKSGHLKNRELRELEELALVRREGKLYSFNPVGFFRMCFLVAGVPKELLHTRDWKYILKELEESESVELVGSFLCSEYVNRRNDFRSLEDLLRAFLMELARTFPSEVEELFGEGYTEFLSTDQIRAFVDWYHRIWIDALSEDFLREDTFKSILYQRLNHKKFKEHRLSQAKILEKNGDKQLAEEIRLETEAIVSESKSS